MNRNKKIIYIMVVLLAVIAGWLYFENSSGKEIRAMGFPSIRAVPDGFDLRKRPRRVCVFGLLCAGFF